MVCATTGTLILVLEPPPVVALVALTGNLAITNLPPPVSVEVAVVEAVNVNESVFGTLATVCSEFKTY